MRLPMKDCMKTVLEYSLHGLPRYVLVVLAVAVALALAAARSGLARMAQLWMEVPVFWLGSLRPYRAKNWRNVYIYIYIYSH